MNKWNTTVISLLALILVITIATGCSALAPKPSALSDDEVLAITENILTALDAGDYDAFTKDFGQEMAAAFPESEFANMQTMLADSSGAYQSCGESKLLNQEDFAVYRFPCQYEKEEVTVTVVMKIDGTTVDGLYFDSPNLRNSAQ